MYLDIAVYETNETGGRVSRYICVYVLFLVLSRNAFSLFHCFSCVHVMEKGYPGDSGLSLSLSLSLDREVSLALAMTTPVWDYAACLRPWLDTLGV